MNKSEVINELAAALSKAQAEFKSAKKDSKNPYYGSNYADMASVIEAIKESLGKHGLSVIQLPTTNLELQTASVETLLTHSSGQWVSECYTVPAIGAGKDGKVKFDAQTIGSAITYARRYALQSFLCLAADDDDGNSLSMEHEKRKPTPARQAAPTSHAEAAPVSPDYLFENGVMDCQVLDARFREAGKDAKGKEKKAMFAIKVNAPAGQKDMVFCFNDKLFHALAAIKKNERAIFAVKVSGEFLNIEDVRSVGGQPYQDGKLLSLAKSEITDADLPEGLGQPNSAPPTPIAGIDDPAEDSLPF